MITPHLRKPSLFQRVMFVVSAATVLSLTVGLLLAKFAPMLGRPAPVVSPAPVAKVSKAANVRAAKEPPSQARSAKEAR